MSFVCKGLRLGVRKTVSVLLMALKRCREGNPIQSASQKPHLNHINDTLLIDQLDNPVGRAAILALYRNR